MNDNDIVGVASITFLICLVIGALVVSAITDYYRSNYLDKDILVKKRLGEYYLDDDNNKQFRLIDYDRKNSLLLRVP